MYLSLLISHYSILLWIEDVNSSTIEFALLKTSFKDEWWISEYRSDQVIVK